MPIPKNDFTCFTVSLVPISYCLRPTWVSCYTLFTDDMAQVRYLPLEQAALLGLKFEAMFTQAMGYFFKVAYVAVKIWGVNDNIIINNESFTILPRQHRINCWKEGVACVMLLHKPLSLWRDVSDAPCEGWFILLRQNYTVPLTSESSALHACCSLPLFLSFFLSLLLLSCPFMKESLENIG